MRYTEASVVKGFPEVGHEIWCWRDYSGHAGLVMGAGVLIDLSSAAGHVEEGVTMLHVLPWA